MPISPKFARLPEPPLSKVEEKKPSCCSGMGKVGSCSDHCMCHGGFFLKKFKMVLLLILLVYVIFWVGTLIHNNIKKYNYIGKADTLERNITVTGVGKVTSNNDIAMTTIGYSNVDKDVAVAQTANKKVMDQVMAALKNLGVADKDMQTNYSVYPDYNYTQDKGQQLAGYRVTNNVAVKIRDLAKIPEILGLAGKYGATEVSGLNFTIDDPENLKVQARNLAIADAMAKAQVLAKSLGIKLGGVLSYGEESGGNISIPLYSRAVPMAEGVGGSAPAVVSSGSNEVEMNVNITYEIL